MRGVTNTVAVRVDTFIIGVAQHVAVEVFTCWIAQDQSGLGTVDRRIADAIFIGIDAAFAITANDARRTSYCISRIGIVSYFATRHVTVVLAAALIFTVACHAVEFEVTG